MDLERVQRPRVRIPIYRSAILQFLAECQWNDRVRFYRYSCLSQQEFHVTYKRTYMKRSSMDLSSFCIERNPFYPDLQ